MVKIYAPTEQPQQHGFKQGDTHIVVNAVTKTAKAYAHGGKFLWERPALADGQHANWRAYQGDTPPGLYKLGALYNDVDAVGKKPAWDRTLASFGWLTFDMIDLEGNEDDNGRSGICLHGGGSGLGWPHAWEALQRLVPTWGCIRMHNQDLYDYVLPRYRQGTVFLSVYQDNK